LRPHDDQNQRDLAHDDGNRKGAPLRRFIALALTAWAPKQRSGNLHTAEVTHPIPLTLTVRKPWLIKRACLHSTISCLCTAPDAFLDEPSDVRWMIVERAGATPGDRFRSTLLALDIRGPSTVT